MENSNVNYNTPFEQGMRIVPDCVKANEGEIPVRQYKVANLRSRTLGITTSKAVGRLQVTNKRVIFRAVGRNVSGKSLLQHEFAIDEIAGVETRNEYSISGINVFISLFIVSFVLSISKNLGGNLDKVLAEVINAIISIFGIIWFFVKDNHWLQKVFIFSIRLYSPLASGLASYIVSNSSSSNVLISYSNTDNLDFLNFLSFTIALVSTILLFVSLFMYIRLPNLVMIIKTKSAGEAIDIQKKKALRFAAPNEHTGYKEVLPAEETEKAISELNALISDIQKLGDFAIEKWADNEQ